MFLFSFMGGVELQAVLDIQDARRIVVGIRRMMVVGYFCSTSFWWQIVQATSGDVFRKASVLNGISLFECCIQCVEHLMLYVEPASMLAFIFKIVE